MKEAFLSMTSVVTKSGKLSIFPKSPVQVYYARKTVIEPKIMSVPENIYMVTEESFEPLETFVQIEPIKNTGIKKSLFFV